MPVRDNIIPDEEVEVINRCSASALRYSTQMYSGIFPFELTSFHYSPFQNWLNNPWHMHSHVEMQYVFHGKAEWTTKQDRMYIQRGDLMIIPAKILHHRVGVKDQAQMLGIHFFLPEKKYGQEALEQFRNMVLAQGYVFSASKDIRNKCAEITSILRSDRPFREQHAGVMIGEIMLSIFKEYMPDLLDLEEHIDGKRKSTQDFQAQVYQTSLKYVDDNMNKSISLDDVARTCGVSTRHLNRIFMRYGGLTVKQHIIRRRIDRSFHMLTQTDLPIDEIADKLGFSDAAHFIRTFQKSTGTTPGEYRRRLPADKT